MPHFNEAGQETWLCQKGGHVCTGHSTWVEHNSSLAHRLGCHGNVCDKCMPSCEITPCLSGDLSNALIGQNDELNIQIMKAEAPDMIRAISDKIDFLAPLWAAVKYGYKTRELRLKLKARVELLLNSDREYLVGLRKNDKTRGTTEYAIKFYEDLLK